MYRYFEFVYFAHSAIFIILFIPIRYLNKCKDKLSLKIKILICNN
jgi:hypothetical protein